MRDLYQEFDVMELENRSRNDSIFIVIIVFLLSLFYSILRYNIFKEVPWQDFPLYVLNKSFALSSLILFVIYYYQRNNKKLELKRYLQEFAILFALVHVLASFTVLTPHYFSKFFSDGKFNLIGSISILFGILAIGFLLPLINKKNFSGVYIKFKNKAFIARIFFMFISVHLFVMGYSGWIEPGTWPGGLPPITLLSFIISVLPIIFSTKNQGW